jgi:hypothetical protein
MTTKSRPTNEEIENAVKNAKRWPFIITDDGVNVFGFRIKTAGIDLSSFEKNPIALYKHQRWGEENKMQVTAIGFWENVRKDQNRLIGDLVFDQFDDFAQELELKVAQGILNAVSLKADPIEWSEEADEMLPGQTAATVTKSVLLEVSLVDLPGNQRAVRLSRDDKEFDINKLKLNKKTENMEFSKTIALALGIDQKTPETDVLGKVQAIKLERDNFEAKIDGYKTQITELEKERNEAVVSLAISSGKIKKEEKQKFIDLAARDFAFCKEQLEAMKPQVVSLQQELDKDKKDGEEKDFDWYRKNDPVELSRIKKEDKERYAELINNRKTNRTY